MIATIFFVVVSCPVQILVRFISNYRYERDYRKMYSLGKKAFNTACKTETLKTYISNSVTNKSRYEKS